MIKRRKNVERSESLGLELDKRDVEIAWHAETDAPRLRRVGKILQDIRDNADGPGDGAPASERRAKDALP